ncbi:hypothetical protein [Inhella sp.]|uniref:hypothetical protein n=1 Tax=Inhella sp. TaxID=1921806 RepID=UPI0035B364EF
MTEGALLQALTDAELQRHFEPRVLDRGRQLAPQVSDLQVNEEGAQRSASAQVPGSEAPYAVRLWHAPGTRLRGQCECVYAADGSPCKHQAALALAWRALLAGEALAPAHAAEAVEAQDWPAFLRAQSSAQLAAFLIAQAEQHPELERAIRTWQRASLPVNDLASSKKAVTALLAAPRDLYEWRRVGAYVRKAEGVLTLLAGWTAQRPEIALGAADWALTKLRKVWEQADDSDGAIGVLMQQLATAYLAALQAAGPQPAAFGKRLHELLSADEHDHFDLPALLQAAGPEASRRFGELCAAAWAREQTSTDPWGARFGSKRLLLAFHQAMGDPAAALALLREALRDEGDHIDLVEELQRQGKPREALAAVEAACQRYPQQPRLRELRLQAWEADGWDAEALAQREEDFARNPSLSGYLGCLRAALRAGHPEATARERLWALLDVKAIAGNDYTAGWVGGVKLELWRHEQRWAEALSWIAEGGRSHDHALQDFALALPEDHHGIAAELLKPLLQRQMSASSSPYTQALRLVAEITRRQDATARGLYLAWLKLEYRAKRRFTEGLTGL